MNAANTQDQQTFLDAVSCDTNSHLEVVSAALVARLQALTAGIEIDLHTALLADDE